MSSELLGRARERAVGVRVVGREHDRLGVRRRAPRRGRARLPRPTRSTGGGSSRTARIVRSPGEAEDLEVLVEPVDVRQRPRRRPTRAAPRAGAGGARGCRTRSSVVSDIICSTGKCVACIAGKSSSKRSSKNSYGHDAVEAGVDGERDVGLLEVRPQRVVRPGRAAPGCRGTARAGATRPGTRGARRSAGPRRWRRRDRSSAASPTPMRRCGSWRQYSASHSLIARHSAAAGSRSVTPWIIRP